MVLSNCRVLSEYEFKRRQLKETMANQYQWFSKCGLGTHESPWDLFRRQVKIYFTTNLWYPLLFSLSLFDKYIVFSRSYMIDAISTDQMQKQIRESRCLLLSQTLIGFAKMKGVRDLTLLTNLFCFGKCSSFSWKYSLC